MSESWSISGHEWVTRAWEEREPGPPRTVCLRCGPQRESAEIICPGADEPPGAGGVWTPSGHKWVLSTDPRWLRRTVTQTFCARCGQEKHAADFTCPAEQLPIPAREPPEDARSLPIPSAAKPMKCDVVSRTDRR